MVTVGATANGYVKGTEATAFSTWNRGIVDRFKNELIPSNPLSQPPSGSNNEEAATNYKNEFLSKSSQCYGFSSQKSAFLTGRLGNLSDDIIQKNISVVTEFYKYILAKEGQKTQQAGTIGFIPFKLSITMDGISGIKIYNKLNVNSSFLPVRYGKTLNFIITGVNHRLQNNDWETTLETIVMPKTSKVDALDIGVTAIARAIRSSGDDKNKGYFKGSLKYSYNETVDFLIDVLKGLGIAKPNESQIKFIKLWRQHEGGSVAFNPFNTTLRKTGSKTFNSKNVQNYISREQGIQATIDTLKENRYSNIVKSIKAIKTDFDINSTIKAINSSKWGSKIIPADYRFWTTLNNLISTTPLIPK